jgi:hypothetical protein
VNQAPSLAPIPDQAIDEGGELRLTSTADDPNFSLADGPQTSTVTIRVTHAG